MNIYAHFLHKAALGEIREENSKLCVHLQICQRREQTEPQLIQRPLANLLWFNFTEGNRSPVQQRCLKR